MMPEDRIFRGPLAICLAIAALTFFSSGALGVYLGGSPQDPENERLVLSYRGRTTEVSQGAWLTAYLCKTLAPISFAMIAFLIAALFVRRIILIDSDRARDYAYVVGGVWILGMATFVFLGVLSWF